MRKIFLIFLIFFWSFIPIGRAEPPTSLKIVTTFYPIYIMTLNVVGNTPGVTVTNLTPPITGCLHDYALTANDMKELAGADILIANGAGMEAFLEQVIRQFPQLKVIRASEGIELIKGPSGVNPHIWVSISGAITEVRNISDGLIRIAPRQMKAAPSGLTQPAENYIGQLLSLRDRMDHSLARYQGQKIVTFHEAFPYFAKDCGLKIAAVVEREPGSAPSAKELAETIDLVKKNRIQFIFSEPQYPADAAQVIARETGAKVLLLDPAVSGPMQPEAYLQIMEKNLKTLVDAFGERK